MGDIFALFNQISKEKKEPLGKPEWLISGLGNPGKEYVRTRHNAGFMAVDCLASQVGVTIERARFQALIGQGSLGGKSVLFMKPQTFMNLSGEAIREASSFYQIPPEKVLVLVDDVYQAPGHIRIRKSGSNGGHNGLGNIIYQLNSDRFPRVRIGVGEKPNPEYDMKDWVLGKFTEDEMAVLAQCFKDMSELCSLILQNKIDDAMCAYNGKVYSK